MDPIGYKMFYKNAGAIRSKTIEKGGQLDQKLRRKLMQNGENWSKISKTFFKLDQLYVHISLELNVIDTNWFFSVERGGQSVATYNRDQIRSTITKTWIITTEPCFHG